MAQSKISKAGSIFERVTGLLKSGLLPWKERPVWYDIYRAFPPEREPVYRTVLSKAPQAPLPPKILYYEDEIRVLYYKIAQSVDFKVLNSQLVKTADELFVEVYYELEEKGVKQEDLIRETVKEMHERGYFIKTRASVSLAKLEAEEEEDLANKAMIDDLDKLTTELENEMKASDVETKKESKTGEASAKKESTPTTVETGKK